VIDVLTLLFRWPLLPMRGLIRLAELLRDQADRELHDPAAVQRQLQEAAEARDAGLLTDEELSQIENEAVGRLLRQPTRVISTGPPGQ